MNRRRHRPMRVAVRLGATALLIWSLSGARAEEPLHIRHVFAGVANTLTPIVFEKKDILKHYGQSYVVDPIRFGGTSPQITALAAGELDIATMGFSSFAAAVLNARMDDLRIIADGFQDGVGDYLSSPYIIRRDAGIATIADLKGKVLVTNAIGGALDVAMRAMLRQHGLEDHRDYSVVEAQFAAMPAMLKEGKADLVSGSPPFIFNPPLTEIGRTLFTMKDAVGQTQMIVFTARAGFLDRNRAALLDFFEDYLRGIGWFLDPANRAAAIEIVARMVQQPAERFTPYLYTKADYYHDPAGRPNIPALQHDMATQHKLGFFKTEIDVGKYVDLSFIETAELRLKAP